MKNFYSYQLRIHLLCIMFFLGSSLYARPPGSSTSNISGINLCPEANAGGPYVGSCSIQLHGSINANGTPNVSGLWVSTTGGTFANPNNLNTAYIPSTVDIANGSVTLALNAFGSGIPTSCFPVPGTGYVTINLASIIDDNNPCTVDACNSVNGAITHIIANGPLPGSAGLISGPGTVSGTLPGTVTISVCSPGTYHYCVPVITGATTYYWWINHTTNPSLTFPGGQTTITTTNNCVDIIIPAGYNSSQELEVRGVNCNGNGHHSEVDIKLISPNDNNPCTNDACNTGTGIATHSPVTNGTAGLTDGDNCTIDVCQSGQTVHLGNPTNDNNPCTLDACNSGISTHISVANGSPGASDYNACTSDLCQSGQTIHNLIPIDDGNSCTTDGCNTQTGVYHTLAGGGNLPSTPGIISGPGTLSGSSTLTVCSPGTYQFCIPIVNGATSYNWTIDHTTNPSMTFSNGLTSITTTYVCVDVIIPVGYNSSQELEVEAVNCNGIGNQSEIDIKLQSPNDNNPCTTDACNSGLISHTPLTNIAGGASDNNLCTLDNCSSGITIHSLISNDDGNPCTTDACNPLTGVTHVALTMAQLSDGNLCTTDACNSLTGISHTALTNVQLDDGNTCTTDACITSTGPTHIALTTAQLSDGNACTTDACNSVIGPMHVALTTTQLDDGNVCTTDACNTITGPSHVALTTAQLDDGNACTMDACNTITGPTHIALSTTQLSDGNACTTDACNSVTGPTHVALTTAQLSDANECTTDACNTTTGPTHIALTTAQLSDGNVCTTDACNSVTGPTHIALTTTQLDDGNTCTTDACNSITGPTHVALTTAQLDDGNTCTTDACNSITGPTHILLTTVQLSDGNVCTTDGCDSFSGVFHTSLTSSGNGANDNNGCTTDDCLSGQTVHTPISVDDNNPCTVDACNSNNGNITHTNGGGPLPATAGLITGPGTTTGTLPGTVTITVCSPGTYQFCVPIISGATSYSWWISHTTTPSLSFSNLSVVTTYTSTTNCVDVYIPPGYNSSQEFEVRGINCYGQGHHSEADIKLVLSDDNNPCTTDECDSGTGIGTHIPLTNNGGGFNDNNLCTDDNCLSGQTVHVLIGSGNPPATAGQISGPGTTTGTLPGTVTITVCSPGTYQFCVPAVSNATSYNWIVDHSKNPSLLFSNGLTSITTTYNCVDVTIPAGYNSRQGIEVRAVNCYGIGHYSEIDIKLQSSDDNNPCTTDACNSAGVVSHVVVLDGSPGASDNNGCTSDVCQSGQTIHNVIDINDGDNCTIDVCNPVNGSITHTDIGLSQPASPGLISGPGSIIGSLPGKVTVTVCSPGTYQFCVATVPGAASYNWEIDHTTNPSLSFSNSSIVTSITTTYNCIDITIPAGYNSSQELEVRAVSCNNVIGHQSEIDVKLVNILATPGNINGSSSVCLSQTRIYNINSVPGAISYVWSVTNNAQIISGQGTTGIQVNFLTATSSSVVVSVYATTTTTCSNSLIQTKNINVNSNYKTSDGLAERSQDVSMNEISVFPNPTSGKAMLTIASLVDCKYNVKVQDILGKVIVDEDLTIHEGLNTKELNLENLVSGVYIISLRSTSSQIKTLRIVVE